MNTYCVYASVLVRAEDEDQAREKVQLELDHLCKFGLFQGKHVGVAALVLEEGKTMFKAWYERWVYNPKAKVIAKSIRQEPGVWQGLLPVYDGG